MRIIFMENRNHKDSLFIDLFCKDQKSGKENFISLYNALHQTNLDLKTTTLEEVNIENILYMALKTCTCFAFAKQEAQVKLVYGKKINRNLRQRF